MEEKTATCLNKVQKNSGKERKKEKKISYEKIEKE